jgi:hypothetical protein
MRTSTDRRSPHLPAASPLSRNPVIRLALLAFALLAFGACAASGSANDPPAGASGLTVQVLLYSGRPDPLFAITDATRIAQVRQLLGQAKPDPAAGGRKTVLPSILGYKGVLILNPAGLGGLPRTIAVYHGNVEVRDGATRFLTGGGALEGFLLDEAVQSNALDRQAVELLRAERAKLR